MNNHPHHIETSDHPLLQLHTEALAHQNDEGRPVSGSTTRRVLLKEGAFARAATADRWAELNLCILDTPERVWLLSDLHIDHAKVIHYTGRPHADVTSMNADLVAALDAIPDDDWLMVLGDVSIRSGGMDAFLKRLPKRSALIFGNHDIQRGPGRGRIRDSLQEAFSARAEAWAIDVPGKRLLFSHYPIPETLLPSDVINLHGHIHHRAPVSARHRNVCVEHTGYRPIRLDTAILAQPAIQVPTMPRANTP